MMPASTHGKKAIACIFVLWPTWMICILYEQKAIAIAPATATMPFTPMDRSSRKAPTKAMKR